MNPYLMLAAVVAAVSLAVGGFVFGVKYESGQNARAEQLVEQVFDRAQLGAAEAIAKNRPVQQIIKQKLETEVRENTVYVNCRNSPDAFRLLNDTLTNRGPDAAGRGELPSADPTH